MKNIRDVQGGVLDPRGKGENLWGRVKNVKCFLMWLVVMLSK